jgi:hypothetical protein
MAGVSKLDFCTCTVRCPFHEYDGRESGVSQRCRDGIGDTKSIGRHVGYLTTCTRAFLTFRV